MTPTWRRYARFWGAHVSADVDDELQFHLTMLIRDYESRGMSPDEARATAVRRLGNLPGARDACLTIGYRRERRMARARMFDALRQDVSYAVRTLARQKGWTTIALLTLALGIGASTAMFSVVNSLILHPLSYVGADRVRIAWLADPTSHAMISPGMEMANAWSHAHSLDAVEPHASGSYTLTGLGDPMTVNVARVNSSFIKLAGASIVLGRTFLPEDEHMGAAPAVLVGEGFWRSKLGASKTILGKPLTIDGKTATVVGVASSALRLPAIEDHVDLWMPARADSEAINGSVLARIRPGVTTAAAQAELDSIAARLPGNALVAKQKFRVKLIAPGELLGFSQSLYLLTGAVSLLLLVACANVAHLLLARGATRERELAIRAALGAGRGRLTRQLITEALLLAATGCALGIGVGFVAIRALLALRPSSLDVLESTRLDSYALLVAIGLSIVTGIAFGLVGAFHALGRISGTALRTSSSLSAIDRGGRRLRSALVVAEMALSAVLLVGSVLLIRSVQNLQRVDLHFNPTDLYSLRLPVPTSRYPTPQARRAFIDDAVTRATRVPGVERVTFASSTPPSIGFMLSRAESEDGKALPTGSLSAFNSIAPEYFDVIGLRLARGRTFSSNEKAAEQEIIVNEGFVQRLWPGEDGLGKHIRLSPPGAETPEPWKTIVGVAANAPTRGLSSDVAEPMFYLSAKSASGFGSVTLVVRAQHGVNPSKALQRLVMSIDPQRAPPNVISVAHALDESIGSQRFTMELLAVFAGFAVLLSAIGLYGVISYVVTQRTREIGIRMALGALPADVARTVVSRGLTLSLIGLSVGLVGALWGTKLIKAQLFGVTGTDVTSYLTTGLALLLVSMVASLVPMRRAMRVDPVIAMRGD